MRLLNGVFGTNRRQTRSAEDIEVLSTMTALKSAIEQAYQNLDAVTDADLIDGFIYEIEAANMKYKYYLRLCKERGLEGLMA